MILLDEKGRAKPNPCARGWIYEPSLWGWLRNHERIFRLQKKIECLEYQIELERYKNYLLRQPDDSSKQEVKE